MLMRIKEKLKDSESHKLDSLKSRTISSVAMSAIMIIGLGTNVFAASNTYADNISNFLISGAKTIGLAITAVYGVKMLTQRAFIKGVSFLIMAAFFLAIIASPDKVLQLGQSLWSIVTGG
ncbi:hypothetical protein IAI10_16225 [Clostridium sp. 19966]|uniref:hypothetical protein n=1 Tax=Clostridium sp. 19966 TaxID=2768166 RepID=UPI0028DDA6DD|nr:hypothetical protein [Clostridium sp. 19966]MDT8718214.1 hypothetical protein [Clostridium sp. 19966]